MILIINNINIENNTNIVSYIKEVPLEDVKIDLLTGVLYGEQTSLSAETVNINENEYMDTLFESIQKYQFSEDNPESGLVQCVNECPGTCLADGYNGSAWCF